MNIDKQEIRRYLGYGKNIADDTTEKLIGKCICEIRTLMNLREVHRSFRLDRDGSSMSVMEGTLTLDGNSIRNHLTGSESCVLMAATLGPEIDRAIRYIERTDLSKALVMDATATAAIEAFCDEIEESIRLEAEKAGLFATFRFSPGYGDLPLSIQPSLLRALDASKRIGLTTTENLILIPRKSVTAIIGLRVKPAQNNKHICKNCTPGLSCPYKKEEPEIEHQ